MCALMTLSMINIFLIKISNGITTHLTRALSRIYTNTLLILPTPKKRPDRTLLLERDENQIVWKGKKWRAVRMYAHVSTETYSHVFVYIQAHAREYITNTIYISIHIIRFNLVLVLSRQQNYNNYFFNDWLLTVNFYIIDDFVFFYIHLLYFSPLNSTMLRCIFCALARWFVFAPAL